MQEFKTDPGHRVNRDRGCTCGHYSSQGKVVHLQTDYIPAHREAFMELGSEVVLEFRRNRLMRRHNESMG